MTSGRIVPKIHPIAGTVLTRVPAGESQPVMSVWFKIIMDRSTLLRDDGKGRLVRVPPEPAAVGVQGDGPALRPLGVEVHILRDSYTAIPFQNRIAGAVRIVIPGNRHHAPNRIIAQFIAAIYGITRVDVTGYDALILVVRQ